jgi:hypothetical protein
MKISCYCPFLGNEPTSTISQKEDTTSGGINKEVHASYLKKNPNYHSLAMCVRQLIKANSRSMLG